mgnify:CR=1 FL=1
MSQDTEAHPFILDSNGRAERVNVVDSLKLILDATEKWDLTAHKRQIDIAALFRQFAFNK